MSHMHLKVKQSSYTLQIQLIAIRVFTTYYIATIKSL